MKEKKHDGYCYNAPRLCYAPLSSKTHRKPLATHTVQQSAVKSRPLATSPASTAPPGLPRPRCCAHRRRDTPG